MRKKLRGFLLLAGISCMLAADTMTSLAAGWEQSGEGWYYHANSGNFLDSSWVCDNGKNYYLGADGRMLTGEHFIGYRTCEFDGSGALVREGEVQETPGLDRTILQEAQTAVQEHWSAIVAGYDLINQERTKNGALPVILNYDLCVAAAYRCHQMEAVRQQTGEFFYSGPDESGQMLWNTVPRAVTGDALYAGTENKSFVQGWRIYKGDHGTANLTALLKDQFTSEPHYLQVIGHEYGQIGIAIRYGEDNQTYYIAEEIKIGE
ncbi:MAG: CAP domain-containing protein [Eubacteriales bacterium]|nr:CAP domain-containing protein [Eubacteriales bacterium]